MHFIVCLSKGLSAIDRAVTAGLMPSAATIGFIPNAGGPVVDQSRQRLHQLGHHIVTLDVSVLDASAMSVALEAVDAVFVADGNVFALLDQLKRHGLDQVIAERARRGMPYFGEGAGAMLAYRDIALAAGVDDASAAPDLIDTTGLGLIDFFPLPHANRNGYRERANAVYEQYRSEHQIVRFADNEAIIATSGFRDDVAYRRTIVGSVSASVETA